MGLGGGPSVQDAEDIYKKTRYLHGCTHIHGVLLLRQRVHLPGFFFVEYPVDLRQWIWRDECNPTICGLASLQIKACAPDAQVRRDDMIALLRGYDERQIPPRKPANRENEEDQEEPEEGGIIDYTELKVPKLRSMLKLRSLPYSGMRKDDMIALLRENES